MKTRYIASILLLLGVLAGGAIQAKAPTGVKPRNVNQNFRTSDVCLPPSASAELDINNVRTLLHNGGDMWWDLVTNPRYEVPRGSGRHSLFAGSLWIGGLDQAGQLRVAAQTYRQSGYDFWPGPLTQEGAAVDDNICEQWDQMYKINATEIDAFRADWAEDGVIDNQEDYPNVFSWPATGIDSDGENVEAFGLDGEPFYLAPFVDVDGDPFEYNPGGGDYPDIQGDQAIWWVINDKGDVHTETGGEPIGVEIHMLAFGFATANAVNDMTFYKQTVINRSSLTLEQTYLGQWVDPDVGNYADDYVGCDTARGLGFCYNGDSNDEGAVGYGSFPPAVGVDFFQGPVADPEDGIDNDKDGIIDEEGETIIMSKFVYYNNDFSLIGNPEIATHYYGYLRGFWKDGTGIVDNNRNGYSPTAPGDPADYMFTGDPCAGTGWTEASAENPPADRRFLQSAGPFTLQAGAVNEVITGVVWARGFFNDQFGSVCKLLEADDVAQALFDNGFTLLDGPDAPELAVSEYDQELLISWSTPETRNNYNESYLQADPVLKARNVRDSLFSFQGYIVYQTIDNTVSLTELNDPDRARVVTQCDIEDDISTIVNTTTRNVEGVDGEVVVDEVMVQGNNEGIIHSVRVTEDLFATGSDTKLKNYSTYYYTVIAYAHNDSTSDGRRFVPGNRFFRLTAAMPHTVDVQNDGTILNAGYGDFIPITQVAGIGNGGNFVEVTEETEAEILANNSVSEITYKAGAAPIQVKVVDPQNVKDAQYRVRVLQDRLIDSELVYVNPVSGDSIIEETREEWILEEWVDNSWDSVYSSTYKIRNDGSAPRPTPLANTERVIAERGISISINDVTISGDTLDANNGAIGFSVNYEDESAAWLSGLSDNDDFGDEIWNWILSGTCGIGQNTSCSDDRAYRGLQIYDPEEQFEALANGRWSPYCLTREFSNASGIIGPGLPVGASTTAQNIGAADLIPLSELPDVDIVFTSDQSKWSRCVVVETSPNKNLGSGAWPMSAKWEDLYDVDGNVEQTRNDSMHGFSYFPGYAIDVNTGERLYIFFGESTWDKQNQGDDMMFNPTANFGQNLDRAGGRHYVYVTNRRYDDFDDVLDTLMNATAEVPLGRRIEFDNGNNLSSVYRHIAWAGIPMTAFGIDIAKPTDIPTETRVSLRVNNPFKSREGTTDVPTFTFSTDGYAANTSETEVASSALDQIRVVPNPYYAYSSYESSQLQNIVKITNLPKRCNISIFTLNGNLVRTYSKDSEAPDQNWDLKNSDGVPVASGVYIVHVDGFDLGEKVVKLFAVMRQVDLDSY